MCGFSGIWKAPHSTKESLLKQVEVMSTCLQHRGPDDSGHWIDNREGVAFGHRRLAIQDLSHAGGQPISFYLLPLKLDKTIYVGTVTLVFLYINIFKLIPYYFLDLLVLSNLKISLLLSPLAPISIYFGYYLHKKFNEEIFYLLIYILLGVSGVKLIYDGLF